MLIFCDCTSSGPQVFESKERITEKVKLFKEKYSYHRYFPWLLTTAIHAVAQNFLTWFLHLSSLKRAARRRWFALKSCWNSKCAAIVSALCFALFRASRSQNPVDVLTQTPFEFSSETRTYAHAHTHLLYPLAFAQRSSCHSNTKLSESPPKHRHGVFYLKKNKKKNKASTRWVEVLDKRRVTRGDYELKDESEEESAISAFILPDRWSQIVEQSAAGFSSTLPAFTSWGMEPLLTLNSLFRFCSPLCWTTAVTSPLTTQVTTRTEAKTFPRRTLANIPWELA